MSCHRPLTTAALAIAITAATTGIAQASGAQRTYKVTIVNVTPGNQFTPILAAVHDPAASVFTLGDAPSDELAVLAETGDTGPAAGRPGVAA